MDKYYWKPYSELAEKDWLSVIDNSPDAWVFHNMEACDFIARPSNAENRSFIVYNSNSNEPVAICPLHVYLVKYDRIYRKNKKKAESFGGSGPALSDKLGDNERREVIRFIGEVLIDFVRKEKIDSCTVSAANLSQFCLARENGYTNPLHELRNNWRNRCVAYYYLDLRKSEDQLKQNLETRARSIIQKFEKTDNLIIRKADINDVKLIYDLFVETSNRTGLTLQQKDRIEWFVQFSKADHYIAFIDSVPACVIRILKYENTALYDAGFTANDFIKTDIATYVLWYGILEIRKQNIEHFDVGSEYFEPPGNKPDNIAKFKRSFGGKLRYKFSSVFVNENIAKRFLKKITEVL